MALLLGAGCTAASPGSLVRYERTGGFVNFDDLLTIMPDGKVTIERRGQACDMQLDQAELAALQGLFVDASFENLDRQYAAENNGADLIAYRVTYRDHVVFTEDTGVPAELQALLAALDELVGRCS